MTEEEYKKTQDIILRVGKDIRFLNLTEFIETIASTESIAPMIDPTAYRAAMKNLSVIKEMAYGLIDFQNKLPNLSSVLEGLADAKQYKESHDKKVVE